jgi:hypothetical protein
MSEVDDSSRVEDHEYQYRRIPVSTGWFQEGVVSPLAFRPNPNDLTGLSLERAILCSPEEAAGHGRSGRTYYVVRVKAADIRDLGLDVQPKPSVHPGHSEIPGLRYDNRRTDAAEEWQVKLAELASREQSFGPYPGLQ